MIFLLVAACALVLCLLLTPLVRRLAVRVGAVDVPHDRKVHEEPTPTLGGVAIMLSVIVAVLVGRALVAAFPRLGSEEMDAAYSSLQLLGILLSASLMAIVGVIDDIFHLSPWKKLAGQVLSSLVLISFGVEINTLTFIRGTVIDLSGSPVLSIFLTVVWLLVFTNIINLIDGLDGLAAGVCLITSLAFFSYGLNVGRDVNILHAMLVSAAVAGSCLGFLRYNFNPAKIFMGDTGSMFLGFILGAVGIQGILKRTAIATLFTPVIILAIPVLDTGLAVLRRARAGKPFHHADKEHIHHRLLNIGHSHRQAVLIIYLWTALLTGVALSLEFMDSKKPVYILLAVILVSFFVITLPRIWKGERVYDDDVDILEDGDET
ncbi:MAG: MraY family glycosyltransferase [Candidatus Geothermincolales bacterium]